MGNGVQTGSTEKKQKKASFLKRIARSFTKDKKEKDKTKKPSEDVQAVGAVTEKVKEDANEQEKGKTAFQRKDTTEKVTELKKKNKKQRDNKSSTSGSKRKNTKKPTDKAQTSTSDKTLSSEELTEKTEERKKAYEEYKSRIDGWKAVNNKHSLVGEVVDLQKEMKEKDEELSSYTEDESESIIKNSGSAQVVEEFEKVSSRIQEKYADKKQLRDQVSENKSVYDMVMHVGDVGDKRREVFASVAQKIDQQDENIAKHITDESEREAFKKKVAETREERVQQAFENIEKSTPPPETKAEKVVNGAKKTGSFLLKIEEWVSDIFGNTSGSYSDISDLIENKGVLEDKIKELRLTNQINADPPEIEGLEFGVMDGIGCGFAAFNFVKTLVETIKAAVDTIKNQDKIDKQENILLFRDFFGKALDLIGNVIDFAGPWIDMVPFLGSCLSILQNLGGIAKASMELVFAGKNRYTVHQSQKKLKERLAQKKKACLEGNHGMDSTLFDITDFSEEGIRKRREILLAYVGLHTDIKKNQKEIDDNQFNGKNFYERTLNRLDTSIFHRKSKENVASGYGEVNEKLAAKMWETKKAHREKTDISVQEHDEYKSKIHAMEALDLLNEYEVENALAHRQNLKMRTNGFDLATSATKLVGNVLNLSGEICTATGVGALAGGALLVTGTAIKTVAGLAEATKSVGSFLNERLENNSQRGKNKEYVRNEMGVALYEKMDVLATIFKANKEFVNAKDDTVASDTEDYVITKMKNDFDYIVGVRKGSDMRVSSIMKADKRDDIISSLSSIFSQDGN